MHKLTRVHQGESLGWHNSKDGAIHTDSDPSFRLMSLWRRNSQEDQDDLRVPAEGYFTAYGYWFPVHTDAGEGLE